MNKILVFFVVSLLATGYVLAVGAGSGAQPTASGQEEVKETGSEIQTTTDLETKNQGENSEIKAQVQTQTNNPEVGQMAQNQVQTQAENGYKASGVSNKGESIQIKSENGFGLKVGGVETKSMLQLKTEEGVDGAKIKVTLSNGKDAEVKIMPSTASETAIKRLGMVNCVVEEGCTIELKEVGKGDEATPAYEVQAETEGKFLGLFKTRAKVKTQVSAETGEILRVKKPFLTSVKTVEATE